MSWLFDFFRWHLAFRGVICVDRNPEATETVGWTTLGKMVALRNCKTCGVNIWTYRETKTYDYCSFKCFRGRRKQ